MMTRVLNWDRGERGRLRTRTVSSSVLFHLRGQSQRHRKGVDLEPQQEGPVLRRRQ